MRALASALSVLLVGLSGCVDPLAATSVPAATGALSLPSVPAGATLETIPNGLRLVWDAVELPFSTEVVIPEGTTIVSLTGDSAAGDIVRVFMSHAETGRRRCNVPIVDTWTSPVTGTATCTGVTAVDRLPDAWTVIVSAPRALGEDAPLGRVQLDLLTTPYDGLLASLDLSQLSRRDFTLQATEVLKVPSFDGVELHVEVTLPEGTGPWPTVLWSSPYNRADRATGDPAAWRYFARDWAERGYAVVSADVRGFGESGGCVEVWGENEQKDQAFLVDWIAEQDWSDGAVGFYGQSYVATTPVQAAVQNPEALKAIVIVAPVNNAYDDWHHGGVPNGESSLSPVAYQVLTDLDLGDPLATALHLGNGLCDPTVVVRANDPRAVYDAFYVERNFTARAADIRAAVLYTQGFEDTNVKSAMIPEFFNAITAPKLGLFGHWVHQHPTRADNEVLMLGWMDQYVKGRALGFERLPAVDVVTNAGTHRSDATWPPVDATPSILYADFGAGALADAPSEGQSQFVAADVPVYGLPLPTRRAFEAEPLADALHVAGTPSVRLRASIAAAETAHVGAELWDGDTLVTWGAFNLAHHRGHDTYSPLAPGEVVTVSLPLLPTEWVFEPGASLRLVISGASGLPPGKPDVVTLHGGADGVALVLPTVDATTAAPLPAVAAR